MTVTGPDGRYVHELVVPLRRKAPCDATGVPVAPRTSESTVRRRFTPTSAWSTVAPYMGQGTADRALRELVAPVVTEAMRSGAADGWFFLRYFDPDFHRRLRLHGNSRRIREDVLPALEPRASSWREVRLLIGLRYDTYTRDIERYGGPFGIQLAERVFHADSEAVLSLVDAYADESARGARSLMALRGVSTLIDDFDMRDSTVADALRGWVSPPSEVRRAWSNQFRASRERIELALNDDAATDDQLAAGVRILETRSTRIGAIADELRALETACFLNVAASEVTAGDPPVSAPVMVVALSSFPANWIGGLFGSMVRPMNV